VNWHKANKKWQAYIQIGGRRKTLGYSEDEKEAARMYDEQAASVGKPVNFPLHEGMEQAMKRESMRKNRSDLPNANRPSKYVGVTWHKDKKAWKASIMINSKSKHLGYYQNEKEAARIFDEQAILLGRSVNFPLHEGMEQAVKRDSVRKNRSELPNANRPSKYVGVIWSKRGKKWYAAIRVDGRSVSLGYSSNEKEAARMYDEQAILVGRPVNFPLHEGMEQAVKRRLKHAVQKELAF
jgi:hypothetical protein